MRLPHSVDSMALFGSRKRGDYDSYSDCDVLIVSQERAEHLEDAFTRVGLSPSIYSWQQLEQLASEGSLFLQHLKLESTIVVDQGDQLQKLLSNFTPKNDYSARLEENRSLLAITNGVPNV